MATGKIKQFKYNNRTIRVLFLGFLSKEEGNKSQKLITRDKTDIDGRRRKKKMWKKIYEKWNTSQENVKKLKEM